MRNRVEPHVPRIPRTTSMLTRTNRPSLSQQLPPPQVAVAEQVPKTNKLKVVFITEYFMPGHGGGEMSLLALLEQAAKVYDLHIIFLKNVPNAYKADWHTTHYALDLTALRKLLVTLQPAALIGISHQLVYAGVIPLANELHIPIIADVQFWRGLVKLVPEAFDALCAGFVPMHLVDIPGCRELNECDALLANSTLTASVVRELVHRPIAGIVRPLMLTNFRVETIEPRYIVCPSSQTLKGSLIFIELAKRNLDLNFLLLAGDCQQPDVLTKAKAVKNLTVNTNWLTDMSEIYAKTRLLFIGTLTCETYCRTAAEARANGIPILAHDSGHLSTIARTGGIVVRRNATIDEWQEGLQEALALTVTKSDEWIHDDSQIFISALNRFRRKPEVGLQYVSARGVARGLINLAKVAGCTLLDRHINQDEAEKYKLMILSGEYNQNWAAKRDKPTAVWWCSHLAQMDICRSEIQALNRLLDDVKKRPNLYYCTSSQADARIWQSVIGKKAKWLPCCLDIPGQVPETKRDGNIKLFIPGHYDVRKNIYIVLAACAITGYEIHVTGLARSATGFMDLAKHLDAKLIVHDCATVEDVQNVARMCHLAIGMSLAETFYYAGLEPVLCGTPCLTWRGANALNLSPSELLVDDPTDAIEVSKQIDVVLRDGANLARLQYTALQRKAAIHNRAARQAIIEMLE